MCSFIIVTWLNSGQSYLTDIHYRVKVYSLGKISNI